jgi:hypothetical protein
MIYLLFSSSLLLEFSMTVVSQEWRGIVPLHSTRNDVERLFGLSSYGGGYAYEFETERVFFQYQYPDNQCGKIYRQWDVPLNTVLEVTVYPKNKLVFSSLKLAVNKFKKIKIHVPSGYRYLDEEVGLSYEVDNGLVTQISYRPSAKDKHLACPKNVRLTDICRYPPNKALQLKAR